MSSHKMLCRVFVGRRIAAVRLPASLAGTQMNPRIAGLYTLITDVSLRNLNRRKRTEFLTRFES